MAKIELVNIKKIYDKDNEVISKLNIEIIDKEFIVLVGPSGCGKTTTLRMIAGLEDITDGELYIDTKKVNNVQAKDRDLAMVFQSYALYPHMSVYENMAFALKISKIPKEEIKRRINEAAEILKITDLLKRKPKQLSGGQRQRVAIGRAIVRQPKAFLMDEPLSNLDAKLRNSMRSEIILLHERLQTTFVYVTHDQVEAMTLGDRIVVMNEGEIQQLDTPQNIYNNPVNLFVATFIGSPQMNIFENAKLKRQGSDYYLDIYGEMVKLGESRQKTLREKGIEPCNVIAGVRAEDINVLINTSNAKEVYEGEEEVFDTEIIVSEMMGAEYCLHVSIMGEKAIVKTRADFNMHNLTSLKIKFDSEKIYLFDTSTEKSLYI